MPRHAASAPAVITARRRAEPRGGRHGAIDADHGWNPRRPAPVPVPTNGTVVGTYATTVPFVGIESFLTGSGAERRRWLITVVMPSPLMLTP